MEDVFWRLLKKNLKKIVINLCEPLINKQNVILFGVTIDAESF